MSSRSIQVVLNGRVLQTIPLDREVLNIGRMRENDIVIDNLSVSRLHAKIFLETALEAEKSEIILEDQKSENGTFVNGKRIDRAVITPADEVVIGKHHLVVTDEITESLAKPVELPVEQERKVVELPSILPERAYLFLRQQGTLLRTILWEKTTLTIGRSPECDIVLELPQISRRHAALTRKDGVYIVEDLDTGNGTLVNGVRKKRETLKDQDRLTLGDYELIFSTKPMLIPHDEADPKIAGTSFAVQDLHVQMQLAEIDGRIAEPVKPPAAQPLNEYRDLEFPPDEPAAVATPAPLAAPAAADTCSFEVTIRLEDLPEELRERFAELFEGNRTLPAQIRLRNKP